MDGVDLVVHCAAALPLYTPRGHLHRPTSTARASCWRRALAHGVERVRPHLLDRGLRHSRSPSRSRGRPAAGRRPVRRGQDRGRAGVPGVPREGHVRADPAAQVVRRAGAARRVRAALRLGVRRPQLPDARQRRQPLPAARRRGPVRGDLPLRRPPTAELVNDTFNIGAQSSRTMREDFQAVLDHAGHGKPHRRRCPRSR